MHLTKTLVKLACQKYKGRDKKWASMIKAGMALDAKAKRLVAMKDDLRKLAKANPSMAKFAALPQYFSRTLQLANGAK